MERLQKVIAASGIASRRKAEELIKQGKVCVNGTIITELGTKVSVDDYITVDGKDITIEKKVYYLLNKPGDVVSTVSDDKNRKTVIDLIDCNERIYPIGRLDYNTTGLLLLTNDGELANILMHPSKKVEKTYVAKLDKYIKPEDQIALKKGVDIDGIKCMPTKVRIKNNDYKRIISTVELTIVEGRNHIVKRVFNKLGYKVVKLNRTEYAFLNLDGVVKGDYRKLTLKEVKKLYSYDK